MSYKYTIGIADFDHPFNLVSYLGNKGHSIVNLKSKGYSVPDGFILTNESFRYILSENGLLEEYLSLLELKKSNEGIQVVESLAEEFRKRFLDLKYPHDFECEISSRLADLGDVLFSVRSSYSDEDANEQSLAGQLNTYLRVPPDQVLTKIKDCWLSQFNISVLFHLFNKQPQVAQFRMGVIVQKMLDSTHSGVCFTTDPINPDNNCITIEYFSSSEFQKESYLAEPDWIVLSKKKLEIIRSSKIIGRKKNHSKISKLKKLSSNYLENTRISENDLQDLANLALSLELDFKNALDIEWCFANDNFYILQIRPILKIDNTRFILNNKKDFKLIFRDKGIPLTYEQMITCHYIKWNCIIFSRLMNENISDWVYAEKKSLNYQQAKINNEHPDYLRSKIDALVYLLEVTIKRKTISSGKNISKSEISSLFGDFERILELYGFMDNQLWDTIDDNHSPKMDHHSFIKQVYELKNNIRLRLDKVFFYEDSIYKLMFNSLSKQFDISKQDLIWYLKDDLLNLFDGFILSEDILNKRKLCSLNIICNNDYLFLEGAEALRYFNVFEDFIDVSQKDQKLSGRVACMGGVVEGEIYRLERDYMKFENRIEMSNVKNKVVIAYNMDPKQTFALTDAKAILTEFGSQLSHASIFARESDIPCIVGVDKLMDTLDNGNRVKVDTINGQIHMVN